VVIATWEAAAVGFLTASSAWISAVQFSNSVIVVNWCAGDLEAALQKQLPGHVNWAATKSEKNFKEFFQVGFTLLFTLPQAHIVTKSARLSAPHC
jgi:hypothetical protein